MRSIALAAWILFPLVPLAVATPSGPLVEPIMDGSFILSGIIDFTKDDGGKLPGTTTIRLACTSKESNISCISPTTKWKWEGTQKREKLLDAKIIYEGLRIVDVIPARYQWDLEIHPVDTRGAPMEMSLKTSTQSAMSQNFKGTVTGRYLNSGVWYSFEGVWSGSIT